MSRNFCARWRKICKHIQYKAFRRALCGVALKDSFICYCTYDSYSPAVTVAADKKRLCIINDVDTADLLMPFIKDDKARSNKCSHRHGLAIASSAAAQCGFSPTCQ